jgi:hypothetical protein
MFLFQCAGATGSMAATAVVCYINDQKLLLLSLKFPMKSSPCDSPSCVQAAFECDFSPPQSQRTCADRDFRRVRQCVHWETGRPFLLMCCNGLSECWQLLTRWPLTQASQAYFSPLINILTFQLMWLRFESGWRVGQPYTVARLPSM